jgi:hypothetical protein
MAQEWPDKDPDAVADYKIDWSPWLAGDEILTSTWTVPSGITKDSDTSDSSSSTIWLSGGTSGTIYEFLNRIVTVSGRTNDQTVTIVVADK